MPRLALPTCSPTWTSLEPQGSLLGPRLRQPIGGRHLLLGNGAMKSCFNKLRLWVSLFPLDLTSPISGKDAGGPVTCFSNLNGSLNTLQPREALAG